MKRVAPRFARSTLASGELVGAISGLGLLVASFLPWYSAGGEDVTAWQAFSVVDLLMAAASIAALGLAVVAIARLSVSYPAAGSAISTGFGALALILIAYRLINPPGSGDTEREIGAWLGLLAAGGITLGGYLGMQEPRAIGTASAG
jgi:hypothetical protein